MTDSFPGPKRSLEQVLQLSLLVMGAESSLAALHGALVDRYGEASNVAMATENALQAIRAVRTTLTSEFGTGGSS